MRISDWSSDVCSSVLAAGADAQLPGPGGAGARAPRGGPEPVLRRRAAVGALADDRAGHRGHGDRLAGGDHRRVLDLAPGDAARSEEHTSELQSLMRISYAVFCLKKTNHIIYHIIHQKTNQTIKI